MENIIEKIKNKVIVSSQAMPDEPFYQEDCMMAMIKSVLNGGAGGLRLAGARDVKNAKAITDVPVIGITKPDKLPDNWINRVYITPSINDAREIIDAGADIIAFDGTSRPRECGNNLAELVDFIKKNNKIAMADIATFEEAQNCCSLGVNLVSTTLSGYTKETSDVDMDEPDFNLLSELVKSLECPIILEGRIWYPQHIEKAFTLGAHAVVVGSAITRPQLITRRFVDYKRS